MFEELKNSWKGQKEVDLPSVEEINKLIKGNRSKMVRVNIFGAILLLLSLAIIVVIKSFFTFKYVSTEYALIAIIAVVALAAIYVFYLTRIIPRTIEETKSADLYINDWIVYKERIKKEGKWFMSFYFVALSIALAVYTWDLTDGYPIARIAILGALAIWIGYVVLVLTPKVRASQEQQVDEIISGYKDIAEQLGS